MDVVVAAVIGLIGGYLIARVQARLDLAQWRRDRLLEFCADLLAACNVIGEKGQDIVDGLDVPYPEEDMRELLHAQQCVRLLGRPIADSAYKCAVAYAAVLRDAYGKAGNPQAANPNFDSANHAAGRFAADAHDFILGGKKPPKKSAPATPAPAAGAAAP